jgi:hypothetical protein
MAEFKRDPAREAAAIARGTTTKEEIERRGGINASGYFGDSYNPNTSLSDQEYAAAVTGKTGLDIGKAINDAIKTKATKANPASSTAGSNTVTAGSTATPPQGLGSATNTSTDTAERKSAYDLLYDEFDRYGLGTLVSDIKNILIDGSYDPAEFSLKVRGTDAYKKRFIANEARLAKGLTALSPAAYLSLEDQYQETMRQYGLPASYYAKSGTGIQEGFNKLIENDISNVELEDRISTAQKRVIDANPEVLASLKQFYPDISNGDILAYTLDPKNAIENIKRKVTAAEIGGAQIGAGLTATAAGAEALAKAGVTGQKYQQQASAIAEDTMRGGQLAAMYKQDPYTQQTAEADILNLPGSAAAKKQTKTLAQLETAAFSGRAGTGAIARDRAGIL